MILYPIELVIQPVLDQLIEMDKKELFRYPVTKDIASDYHDIIKQPMSFNDVIEKLSCHLYLSLDEFEADLSLIWKNSMMYNKKDTLYYKLAQRLEKNMYELLEKARDAYENLKIGKKGFLDVKIDDDIFSYGEDNKQQMQQTSTKEENNNTHVLKRFASDLSNDVAKKARLNTPDEDQSSPQPQKKVTRVTRSRTENEKRALRSRSITKRSYPSLKTSKSTKPKSIRVRKQESSPNQEPPIVKFEHGEIVWARVPGFPPHPAQVSFFFYI